MDDIGLLLAHADDAAPVLGENLPREAINQASEGHLETTSYLNDGVDPNDLEEQRWGVVAAKGAAGDRLLELVAPLIAMRQEQQGGRPVVRYRVEPGQSEAAAATWLLNVYNAGARADVPLYVLILGDFDQVSLELQQVIDAACTFTGRLAFRKEQDYEAYVAKVLRWEQSAEPAPSARQLVYTVRDGTAATTMGYSALMAPSLSLFKDQAAAGNFRAGEIVEIDGGDSSPDALLAQAAAGNPAVLFSMSHGLGTPRKGWASVDEQRLLQGAMSLGNGQKLTAEDVARRPFLPGGMWFFLACYSGGTPATSVYYPWLKALQDAGRFSGRLDSLLTSLPKAGERPFVAALPQAALANPDGPLAVIAHVDLAWTYSFQDAGGTGTSRASRFEDIFRSLTNGDRSGIAHRALVRAHGDATNELIILQGQEAAEALSGAPAADAATRPLRKSNLWMTRRDLGGYVLLGDPAAKLPIVKQKKGAGAPAPKAPEVAVTPAAPVAPVAPVAPATTAFDAAATTSARDPERMEEAVLAFIAGDVAPKKIAADAGTTVDGLKRWEAAYRAAGRAALAGLK